MIDEYHGAEDMNGLFYCPICQQTTTVVKDGKCPKCGATMDELSTRTQQTGDAISRQAAIYVASGYCHSANVAKELAKLPSVNPQPKQRTGRWEIISGNNSRCSICGVYNPPDYFNRPVIYNYCPFCGAKMEKQA